MQAGRLQLLQRLADQLDRWGKLLERFLRSEDDQVEVLLTLEEFCVEDTAADGLERGAAFASIFPQARALSACERTHGGLVWGLAQFAL